MRFKVSKKEQNILLSENKYYGKIVLKQCYNHAL